MSELRRRHANVEGTTEENVGNTNLSEKEGADESEEILLTKGTDDKEDANVKDDSVTPSAAGVKDRLLSTVNILKGFAKCFAFTFAIWFLGYLGFSVLWIVIGVLIYTWRKRRQEQKRATAEVLGHIADNEKKFFQTVKDLYKLSGKELPSWVYFPDVEKAEWLNRILEQLWPYVGAFVKNTLTEKIEPSIQQSNRLLEGFSFSKIDLGEKAPRISGVKVYGARHTRRSEIVMDLQLVYMSDADIRVTINRLSVGIKDLTIRGLIRVELRPLINNIPLVGAVSVSFVQMPAIDFDLTDLGNLFDIPGLDSIIRSAVTDTVSSMMVLPERYVVKLADDIDVSKLMFPLPKGVVRIHVIEARDLEEKDRKILGLGGGSDPFVVVKVGRDTEFKTDVIKHNVNPKWDKWFECPVMDIHTSKIEIALYDDDGPLSKAEFLGSASVPMENVHREDIIEEWIPLSHVMQGEVHVRIEWMELSDDVNRTMEAMENAGRFNLNSALLNVYVDSAKDLPSLIDGRYEPSPAVKIKLKLAYEKPFKTKVVENSNNPVWEENFRALVSNPRNDTISIKIVDVANDEELLGALKIRMGDLLNSPHMTKDQPFDLVDSGPNAKLQLRASIRLLVPKEPIVAIEGSKKSSFSITELDRKPRMEELQPPSNSAEAPEHKEESSPPPSNPPVIVEETNKPNSTEEGSTDGSELNFVDKTLALFVANSPTFGGKNRDISRSASTTSDLSIFDESKDPRNRVATNSNNSVDVPFLGRLQMQMTYSAHREKLFVEVCKAERLIACDEDDNTSDPYVRIYLLPGRRGSHKRKTKVVKNNLNPEFNESLEFDVMREEVRHHQLDIAVKNKTGLLSSEKALMGQIRIDLKNYDFNRSDPEWYALKIFAEGED